MTTYQPRGATPSRSTMTIEELQRRFEWLSKLDAELELHATRVSQLHAEYDQPVIGDAS